jgi:ribitol-5-phosphate 2-dehydrogenase
MSEVQSDLPLKITEVVAREYCLAEPFRFIERKRVINAVPEGWLLLKPVVAGICGSEMLYFKGQKEAEKLKKRLPMCLLHEGVAEVVKAGHGARLQNGTRVVVDPLVPCGKCRQCRSLRENLCREGRYMAATADGLARTFFVYPESRVVPVPEGVSPEVAALAEPVSVALNAVESAGLSRGEKVAVIGDGTVGYLVAVAVSSVAKVPAKDLYFVGVVDEKLALARDFASPLNSIKEKARLDNLSDGLDVVFEAAGGGAHRVTVAQAVRLLRPGGRGVLLGISLGEVPVSVTDVVNKGLTLTGSTRSRIEHYVRVLNLLKEDAAFRSRISRAISGKRFTVRSPDDLDAAFRYADTEEGEARVKPGRVLVYFP